MADAADRVTRVAADLLDSAAAEGRRQSRSAKQQLDHWARVGRAVSSQHTAARQRVEAALAGQLELRELSVEEGVVFNAEISAAIQESLANANYAKCFPSAASPPWRSTTPVSSSSSADGISMTVSPHVERLGWESEYCVATR